MTADISKFYQELEEKYETESVAGVEDFLLKELYFISPSCPSCFNPMEVTICNELGSFYRGMGNFQSAEIMLERARALIARYIGEDSAEYATILTNLATCFRLSGHPDKAIRLFEKSAAIYIKNSETDASSYLSMLNNLSLVYMDKGDYNKAEEYLNRVLAGYADNPEHRREYAIALNNLGTLKKAKELTLYHFGKNYEYDILCRNIAMVHESLEAE